MKPNNSNEMMSLSKWTVSCGVDSKNAVKGGCCRNIHVFPSYYWFNPIFHKHCLEIYKLLFSSESAYRLNVVFFLFGCVLGIDLHRFISLFKRFIFGLMPLTHWCFWFFCPQLCNIKNPLVHVNYGVLEKTVCIFSWK